MDDENLLNDILQRIQEGLLTQDLNSEEVNMLIGRFGCNWFEDLGYNNLKPNREPKFNVQK